jgi:hypothetical protein
MESFGLTFGASLLAAAVTTGGILTIRRCEAWARQNTTYFACFAAGVLLAVSFMHVAPKSFAINTQALAYLLAGYLVMHFLNRFLPVYVCDKPQTAKYALGLVPFLGIGFHSFYRRSGVLHQLQREPVHRDGCGARDGAARVSGRHRNLHSACAKRLYVSPFVLACISRCCSYDSAWHAAILPLHPPDPRAATGLVAWTFGRCTYTRGRHSSASPGRKRAAETEPCRAPCRDCRRPWDCFKQWVGDQE